MASNLLIVTPIYPPDIGGPATYVSELEKRIPTKPKVIVYSKRFRQLDLFLRITYYALRTKVIYAQGTLTVGLMSVLIGKLFSKIIILKFVGDEVWEKTGNSTLEDFYSKNPKSIPIFLHRLALYLADQIVVPPKYLYDFLIKYHHINKSKITVIPNAFELPPNFHPRGGRPLTPGVDNYRLIYVGRLKPWKNVDQIIETVKLARDKHPWTLTIVGSGNLSLPQHDWITYTGQLPKLETLQCIAESKALILYSSYEGHPHTILEAHALGVPTIASDISPHQDLGCFKLVPLNQPTRLASVINSLLDFKQISTPPSPPTWQEHIASLNRIIQSD